MKESQPLKHEDSRVADVDKAHYMAENARRHANMAALGRKSLRAAEAAENIRTERKVSIYEASGVFAMFEQITDAGMLTMTEVYVPSLGKVNDAMRGAYRSKLETWVQKQDARADRVTEEAARRYDANEGHPERIADVDKAHKKAEKIKKQIEWYSNEVQRRETMIARIDASGRPHKHTQKREYLQREIDQMKVIVSRLKRA